MSKKLLLECISKSGYILVAQTDNHVDFKVKNHHGFYRILFDAPNNAYHFFQGEEQGRRRTVKSHNVFYHNQESHKEFFDSYRENKLRELLEVNDNHYYPVKQIQEQFLHDNLFEEELDNFCASEKGVLALKSPMGTGKSNIIDSVLKRLPQDKVLFVTMRVSLADEIANKHNVTHYKDKHAFCADKLVCQIDSLWQFDVDKFDTIILDEFQSILDYLSMMFLWNNAKPEMDKESFFEVIKHKRVFIADAFLEHHSLQDLFQIKSKDNRIISFIENTYRDDAVVTCFRSYKDNINFLIKELLTKEDGEMLSLSHNSVKALDRISQKASDMGFKVAQINSDTKKQFNINALEGYDLIGYSPTITVGVNILNNIKTHFHFDIGGSVSALSSIQMLRRVRQAKNIYCYMKGHKRKLNLTYNGVLKAYTEEFREYNINSSTHGKIMIECTSNYYNADSKLIFRELLKQQFNRIMCV